jgi:hypothetical protein
MILAYTVSAGRSHLCHKHHIATCNFNILHKCSWYSFATGLIHEAEVNYMVVNIFCPFLQQRNRSTCWWTFGLVGVSSKWWQQVNLICLWLFTIHLHAGCLLDSNHCDLKWAELFVCCVFRRTHRRQFLGPAFFVCITITLWFQNEQPLSNLNQIKCGVTYVTQLKHIRLLSLTQSFDTCGDK